MKPEGLARAGFRRIAEINDLAVPVKAVWVLNPFSIDEDALDIIDEKGLLKVVEAKLLTALRQVMARGAELEVLGTPEKKPEVMAECSRPGCGRFACISKDSLLAGLKAVCASCITAELGEGAR